MVNLKKTEKLSDLLSGNTLCANVNKPRVLTAAFYMRFKLGSVLDKMDHILHHLLPSDITLKKVMRLIQSVRIIILPSEKTPNRVINGGLRHGNKVIYKALTQVA